MSKFNIGDRVKVVHDFHIWLVDHGLDRETILTIIEDDSEYGSYVNPDDETVEIGAVKEWPDDFVKVEDKYFAEISSNQVEGGWKLNKDGGFEIDADKFLDKISTSISEKELGVFRPNLEDRKVGKVQMHMVDDGFPNALREVAKVMTWAAEAKGYKLHDWKNLPNAGEAFPSAGYRHRNDNSIQKALGLSPAERVDHESALLHKAHEAFNVLAELELILTGVIK